MSATVTLSAVSPTDVLIYEFGARLDKPSQQLVHDELFRAHQLYNNIVAIMQDMMRQIAQTHLDAAGDEAHALHEAIERSTAAFAAAKTANDEDGMRQAAQERRAQRRQLWDLLAAARKDSAVRELTRPLYAQIGRNSTCATYKARGAAVAAGLGWATANAVLDAALVAWKKTSKLGRAPRFARFGDRQQMTLTLQFTAAGGIPAADLLAGRHSELVLSKVSPGRRSYGDFLFRVGAAKADQWARGTWQYHRPLPDGASIGLVRMVARRHADKWRYALQYQVKLPEPINVAVPGQRKSLVALHVGWASDLSGRRIAGRADGADPGLATLVRLPPEIESDIDRAAEIQATRDAARDALVASIKTLDVPDLPEPLADEYAAIRRLPPQHVAARRLGRFAAQLLAAGITGALTDCLLAWRGTDRKAWQAQVGLARRARNRRREHYRAIANDLVCNYAAIATEMPDLRAAAVKIDEDDGERSEFTRAARAGRFVAGLSELKQAIGWACTRSGTPLIELAGAETVSACPYCGGVTRQNPDDWHLLDCTACGAQTDRKLAGAARAWQIVHAQREDLISEYHAIRTTTWNEAVQSKTDRLAKMAAARKKVRAEAEGFRERPQKPHAESGDC